MRTLITYYINLNNKSSKKNLNMWQFYYISFNYKNSNLKKNIIDNMVLNIFLYIINHNFKI